MLGARPLQKQANITPCVKLTVKAVVLPSNRVWLACPPSPHLPGGLGDLPGGGLRQDVQAISGLFTFIGNSVPFSLALSSDWGL